MSRCEWPHFLLPACFVTHAGGLFQRLSGGAFHRLARAGLLALLLLSLLISRSFCRYLCPLGAIYGLFNRIALAHLDYAQESCVNCGACESVCPMGIDPKTQFNSAECIRCGRCSRACPTSALNVRFGLRTQDKSHKKSTM